MQDKNTTSEEWRPVPGASLYIVSNQGRIYNLKTDNFLGPCLDDNGYSRPIFRMDGGKRRRIRRHVVVSVAFHGPRPFGMHVCHNNGKKEDNRAINLRFATPPENSRDMLRHATCRVGEDAPFAKLRNTDIPVIRKRFAAGEGQTEIAADYCVSNVTIHNIVRRKTWAWLGD